MSNPEKSVLWRILSEIFTPITVSFASLLVIAFLGDLWMGVWQFVYGYTGFLSGSMSTPMTPFTDGMSIFLLFSIPVLLYRKKVKILDSIAIALATILAAVTSFEFWWNMFFLIRQHLTSWYNFPGSFWHYAFAFNSLVVIWFVGIKYWKISKYTIILLLSYPVAFAVWYLSGYPQPWDSTAISSAYMWNATVKVISFIALAAPVFTFGLQGQLTEARPPRRRSVTSYDSV